MKKVVLCDWRTPSAIKAIESLKRKGVLDVVAWFGEGSECTHQLDELLHQFKFDDPGFTGAGLCIYPEIYKSIIEVMDQYSRVYLAKGKTVQELLNILSVYLDYFANLLTSNNVEMVLFSCIPHFGVETLLYKVAHSLGIKTVLAYQSQFPDRFFYVYDVDDFGSFSNIPSSCEQFDFVVENKFEKELFFMKNIKYRSRSPYGTLLKDIVRFVVPPAKKPMTLSGAIQKFQLNQHYKHYSESLANEQIDFTKKYVYFPLQLQPELTTSALGGIFSDQLLAIEHLRQMIPRDWFIYVKENPKQKQRQRGEFFYKRLKRIPNMTYVSQRVNTYNLIQNSQFVASITGTVGWEAITGGKKALVFGKAWYKNFPGVFSYRDDLSVEEILNCQIVHDEVQCMCNNLLKKTARGVVDPSYSTIVEGYNDDDNAVSLQKFLESVV